MNKTQDIRVTSIGGTLTAADRIGAIGESMGMHKYRVPDLLLIAWDMLTEEQQHEAHKRLFARNRRDVVTA